MGPMTPEEFEEAKEAAEEDELEHKIEKFESVDQWNVYVAATNAELAERAASTTEGLVNDYEHLGKVAGLGILAFLAAEGLQGLLGKDGY